MTTSGLFNPELMDHDEVRGMLIDYQELLIGYKMRYWCYNSPVDNGDDLVEDIVEVISEKEIIDTYYPTWYNSMVKKFGKDHVDATYCEADCIDDWVVVNWAWESTDE